MSCVVKMNRNFSSKLGPLNCILGKTLRVSSGATWFPLQFTNTQSKFDCLTNTPKRRLTLLRSNSHVSLLHPPTVHHGSILGLRTNGCCQPPTYQQMIFSRSEYTTSRQYSTKPSQDDTHTSHSNNSTSITSKDAKSSDFELVYTAPLKGAVRAIKIFSLTTAAAAMIGGPVLVWMGNTSVPLVGRVMMSTLVMLVGFSTTALLHWLVKGYVIQMYFNKKTDRIQLYTLSMIGQKKLHEFEVSDAKPPSATAFSSFQARGKSYFIHAEVLGDDKLMSRLLGVYADIERTDM